MSALAPSRDVSPDELRRRIARAREELGRAEQSWNEACAGGTSQPPTEDDVNATRAWLARSVGEARAARASIRRLWVARSLLRLLGGVQWLAQTAHRLLGLSDGQRWASGILTAAVLIGPFVVLYGLFHLPASWFVALILVTFIVLAAAATVLTSPSRLGVLAERLERNRDGIAAARKQATEVADLIQRLTQHLNRAIELRDRYAALVETRDEFEQLQAILSDQRYQLHHTDWRALRGVPFEQFLQRVFQVLGYDVLATKASGDQGVDLIVTGKGRRIAVQAKGYDASVGNKAVQEAYAGMTFYKCAECVVITNSQFTAAATELAVAVDCVLVDGSRIPDLIEGRIY